MQNSTWKLDPWTLLLWGGLVAAGLMALYSITRGPAVEYLSGSVRDDFSRSGTRRRDRE